MNAPDHTPVVSQFGKGRFALVLSLCLALPSWPHGKESEAPTGREPACKVDRGHSHRSGSGQRFGGQSDDCAQDTTHARQPLRYVPVRYEAGVGLWYAYGYLIGLLISGIAIAVIEWRRKRAKSKQDNGKR